MAITASKGNPTPVIRKPIMAIINDSPANWPSKGGKIIFPAPKNSANNIKPTTIFSPTVNLSLDFI